jgi:lipopolysaccharide export LptBFGC system permease protein LptF
VANVIIVYPPLLTFPFNALTLTLLIFPLPPPPPSQAAVAAKQVADVMVVSAFADVDALYDKVARAGDLAPTLDAWTAQVG